MTVPSPPTSCASATLARAFRCRCLGWPRKPGCWLSMSWPRKFFSSPAARDWCSRSLPATFQRLLDIVLEQVPDLVHAIGKIGILHAFHSARTRHIDGNDALDQSWPRTHHRDAIAKRNRFFSVLGDENHSFLVAFPDA